MRPVLVLQSTLAEQFHDKGACAPPQQGIEVQCRQQGQGHQLQSRGLLLFAAECLRLKIAQQPEVGQVTEPDGDRQRGPTCADPNNYPF